MRRRQEIEYYCGVGKPPLITYDWVPFFGNSIKSLLYYNVFQSHFLKCVGEESWSAFWMCINWANNESSHKEIDFQRNAKEINNSLSSGIERCHVPFWLLKKCVIPLLFIVWKDKRDHKFIRLTCLNCVRTSR